MKPVPPSSDAASSATPATLQELLTALRSPQGILSGRLALAAMLTQKRRWTALIAVAAILALPMALPSLPSTVTPATASATLAFLALGCAWLSETCHALTTSVLSTGGSQRILGPLRGLVVFFVSAVAWGALFDHLGIVPLASANASALSLAASAVAGWCTMNGVAQAIVLRRGIISAIYRGYKRALSLRWGDVSLVGLAWAATTVVSNLPYLVLRLTALVLGVTWTGRTWLAGDVIGQLVTAPLYTWAAATWVIHLLSLESGALQESPSHLALPSPTQL